MNRSDFNHEAATILRDCAELLRLQSANPFRINAYVRAAITLETLEKNVLDIIDNEGLDGLIALPTIGHGLAVSIAEIARTGRLTQLDRLRGSTSPEKLFQSMPGIGPSLASAIHENLAVETLEALEVAAHDGRLAAVPGIGPRRTAVIQSGLVSLLGRRYTDHSTPQTAPSVKMILDVDREYRDKVAKGSLPKIAPRRFNPERVAWLPILHTDRHRWHFTALFSNTARAHKLKRTDDWVVLFFYDGEHREGQCTIVTETRGALIGQRVVRGREPECHKLRR